MKTKVSTVTAERLIRDVSSLLTKFFWMKQVVMDQLSLRVQRIRTNWRDPWEVAHVQINRPLFIQIRSQECIRDQREEPVYVATEPSYTSVSV